MDTTYIAELNKISSKDITILSKAKEEDTIIIFCDKTMTMTVETHIMLSEVKANVKFFTAETEAEKCLYAGTALETKIVLMTGVTFPPAVKKILCPTEKKAQRKTVEKKTTEKKMLKPSACDNQTEINKNIAPEKEKAIRETKNSKSDPGLSGLKYRFTFLWQW